MQRLLTHSRHNEHLARPIQGSDVSHDSLQLTSSQIVAISQLSGRRQRGLRAAIMAHPSYTAGPKGLKRGEGNDRVERLPR
jgi:hypothetical protein